MNTLRSIRFLCAAALLCGCSDTREEAAGGGGVTVLFRADAGGKTRTELTSSAVLQHVASAWLYIFRGTGNGAVCIACEDVGWAHQDQHTTVSQRYTVRQPLPAGQYTLLSVGLDDRAGTTYSLPGAIVPGTVLANARAVLSAGLTPQDIAASELFAGSAVATVTSGARAEVPITLSRRVAGILGYFKHIPAEVDGMPVLSLRVLLHKQQYADVPLLAQAGDGDHGMQTLADSRVVLDFDLESYSVAAGQSWLAIPARTTGGVLTVEDSLFGACYLLPLDAPASAVWATMAVQLRGPEIYQDQGPVLLKSYIVKLASGAVSFPLLADNLYCMGRKPAAESTTADDPLDLSALDDVEIVVHAEWMGTIDVPLE